MIRPILAGAFVRTTMIVHTPPVAPSASRVSQGGGKRKSVGSTMSLLNFFDELPHKVPTAK